MFEICGIITFKENSGIHTFILLICVEHFINPSICNFSDPHSKADCQMHFYLFIIVAYGSALVIFWKKLY